MVTKYILQAVFNGAPSTDSRIAACTDRYAQFWKKDIFSNSIKEKITTIKF